MIFILDTDTLIFMIRGMKKGRSRSIHARSVRLVKHCRQSQQEGPGWNPGYREPGPF